MFAPPGDIEHEFLNALADAGLSPLDGTAIPADGRLHRFRGQGDKPQRRNGWAVLYVDGIPHGIAGNWRTGERINWTPTGVSFTAAEHKRLAKLWRQREAERAKAQERAAHKAVALWQRLPAGRGDHPYLVVKRVGPGPCRVTANGALTVPVLDATTGEMVSLQFIAPDGAKRFLAGGRTVGGCCIIGDCAGEDPIVVVEGYATAASIRDATGWLVVAAFTAGNLKAVAEAIRAKHPDSNLILASDNDAETDGNPGVAKATQAAHAVGAWLAIPPEPGDFNDLAVTQGPAAVRAILESAGPPDSEWPEPEPKAQTDHEAIARLAKMTPVSYDRVREAEATRLGCRVTTLDRTVARKRSDGAEEGSVGGSAVLFPDLEIWPGPVDGAALLDALAATFTRHVVLPAVAADAAALWVLHAHAHDAAGISPLLAITSPTPECGKTTLLTVLGALVPRPLPASNITTAALFRAVEKWHPTLLVDEADTFMRDNNEMRGIINSGHNRSASFTIRTAGDDHEPRRFTTWGPKVISLIGKLPATLASRAIHIELRRLAPGEHVEPIRADRLEHLTPLARKAARWTADHGVRLRDAEPTMPATLTGRRADNWRPLFAIAETAGEAWPERARRAAEALSAADAGETAGIVLLGDVRDLFKERGGDRIASKDLAEALGGRLDRPWPEWSKGKPITERQVARLLGLFAIRPTTIRIGSATPKGYRLDQFHDAFSRYLPGDPQHRHNPQETAGNPSLRSATRGADVADRKTMKPAENPVCGGVADELSLPSGLGVPEATEAELEEGVL